MLEAKHCGSSLLSQSVQHYRYAGGQLAVPEESRQEVLGSDEVSEQVRSCAVEYVQIIT